MKKSLGIALRGMAMGMAEVVPGVSGGTIAFVTGIYERLLNAIKQFDPSLIKVFNDEGFNAVLKKVDFYFLLALAMGMIGGLIIGLFGIHYLLEHYPPAVWAFFFGLILASVGLLYRQIIDKTTLTYVLMTIGTIVAAILSFMLPTTGSSKLIYVFLSGFLAISALILPGISGSFILLLLGMYLPVTGTVKAFISTFDTSLLPFILVFALGCLSGVVVLSRVLTYTFKKYHDQTLAILTGFVLGSLVKIWPWQNPKLLLDKEDGDLVPFGGQDLYTDQFEVLSTLRVTPSDYFTDPMMLYCVISFIAGYLIITRLEKKATF